ncbi:hypothetical protein [Polaribacter staleyi]|uniref:hypothetical protein n=1 Tax=Polaribacter staleyi TaxID=2022337 RepID=UPI0031BA21DE
MKKLALIIILISIILPTNTVRAQSNGGAAAAVVGGLVAIGAGIAAVKQMEEQAELVATEWILTNHDDFKSFSLKTMDFNGKKLKDMSSTSVITYKLQEFTPADDIDFNGKKRILFGFTSPGWVSQYGINFDKVKWFLIDESEWMNMMVAYVKVSSNEKNESTLKETLIAGKIVNKGVRLNRKMEIPFYKLEGDMYLVSDYSEEMKLIYNERSLGIFLKETKDLVQIGRGNLINIHDYFFDK